MGASFTLIILRVALKRQLTRPQLLGKISLEVRVSIGKMQESPQKECAQISIHMVGSKSTMLSLQGLTLLPKIRSVMLLLYPLFYKNQRDRALFTYGSPLNCSLMM